MAHEINNPLGGLFNAIDTLKTHGETPGVRETSISLIERGLAGIRDVVEAALADLSARTIAASAARRKISKMSGCCSSRSCAASASSLDWDIAWNGARELPVSGGPVRQAVLNLLLNASAATPEGRRCLAQGEQCRTGGLVIEIGDQGPGMPPEIAGILVDRDPGPAVRAGRGLGLWMVRRMVDELGGSASIAPKQRRRDGGDAGNSLRQGGCQGRCCLTARG